MQALDQLLQLPDNDLLDMVMQRQACTDARIGALLQMLHALSFGATHLGALAFVARHASAGQAATAQGYLAIAQGLAMAGAMGISGVLYASFGNLAYAAMALAAVAGGVCALVAHRAGGHATL